MEKHLLVVLTLVGLAFAATGQTAKHIYKAYNYATPRQSGASLPDGPSTATGCNCTIPLDSSFAIVPFNGDDGCNGCPGIPPQYRNDDSFTDTAINLPFNFCFYGQTFNQVYINNNGNISFGSSYSDYTAVPFPEPLYSMIAPFWADVDTRDSGSGLVYYKVTPTAMIVKWDSVGYYDTNSDKVNTFQVIITNGSDPLIPGGNNVSYCYGEMQWTTGDVDGEDGFGGTPATVGVNEGDAVHFLQLGTFDHPGTDYNGPYGNTSGVGWLANQVFTFNVCSGSSNIPPLANGISACDTFRLCIGDTLNIPVDFLSPEDSQITSVTIHTTPGLLGWTVSTNTSGNPAVVVAQLIAHAANPGKDTITFTATDNGTPPGTTVINVFVFIDTSCSYANPPTANFFTTLNQFCADNCIDFTNQSINATSYQWTFSGAEPSTSTDKNPQNICYETEGTFNVSLVAYNSGGKDSVTLSNYIDVVSSPPIPYITQIGDTLYCSTNPSYISYQWFNDTVLIPGAIDTSLVISQSGNYNVQVANGSGCKTAVGINIILGLQNYVGNTVVSLYPNPAENQFTVYGLQFTVGRMEIYNVLGQVCQQSEITNPKSEIVVDVSMLPSGMYFVQITGEKERWAGRFVKE